MLWEAVFAVLVIFSLYSLASFCQRERNVSLVYQAGLRLTQNRHTASCLSSKVEVHSKSTHSILSIKQVWGSLKIDTQLLFYQAGLRLTQNRHTASYLSSKVEAHSKSTHIILSIKQGWDSLKIDTQLLVYQAGLRLTQNQYPLIPEYSLQILDRKCWGQSFTHRLRIKEENGVHTLTKMRGRRTQHVTLNCDKCKNG